MAILTMCGVLPVNGQDADNFITVSGVVKNRQNNKKIVYASVFINRTNIGTVTNEDGEFVLKVRKSQIDKGLIVSHIGYLNESVALSNVNTDNIKVLMTQKRNMLDEVVVKANVCRNIVSEAIHKIADNYQNRNVILTGFYRETSKKKSHYINISEAILEAYKTDYAKRDVDYDRVRILKGRKLLSQKSGDTLAVKLLGGPNICLYMDAIKNPELFLEDKELQNYNFVMMNTEYIDSRPQYVIVFAPNVKLDYALFNGRMYIDKENMAITRLELSVDMGDRNKITSMILKKKPLSMRFKPLAFDIYMTYKECDGKMCLNYVRDEIKFQCDWKKKLFHTQYDIVSEMVVTDVNDEKVKRFSFADSFRDNDVFADKVGAFYDDNFWGNYNILTPSESLDKAVRKLKKQER